jgi:integrase
MAREGVDLPTIQAILRHQSATTTARYLRKLVGIGNVVEDVFCGKKEAPEVTPSEASKR